MAALCRRDPICLLTARHTDLYVSRQRPILEKKMCANILPGPESSMSCKSCVCVCVCACARVCARVRVCVCVCVCMWHLCLRRRMSCKKPNSVQDKAACCASALQVLCKRPGRYLQPGPFQTLLHSHQEACLLSRVCIDLEVEVPKVVPRAGQTVPKPYPSAVQALCKRCASCVQAGPVCMQATLLRMSPVWRSPHFVFLKVRASIPLYNIKRTEAEKEG